MSSFIVLRHWALLLFILINIQFGVNYFFLHVLLYHIAVLVLYNFFPLYVPILINLFCLLNISELHVSCTVHCDTIM